MTRLTLSLVALLSLLGVPSATAAPGPAQLIAPSGDVAGTTLTFSWQSEPTSTWYQLWLGKGTPTALVMEVWYTAAQAGCASGGTCSVSLTPPLSAGGYTWFVQTWNASGFGPWSTGKVFIVKDPMPNWSGKLPDARRFTLVFNDLAVLDNETGLVWERQPSTVLRTWASASVGCLMAHVIANRRGWRLPTAAELSSLLANSPGSALPAGHPFDLGPIGDFNGRYFWTQTTYPTDQAQKVFVSFVDSNGGGVGAGDPTSAPGLRTWCVRSPSTSGS